jgi:hypothetical protein
VLAPVDLPWIRRPLLGFVGVFSLLSDRPLQAPCLVIESAPPRVRRQPMKRASSRPRGSLQQDIIVRKEGGNGFRC